MSNLNNILKDVYQQIEPILIEIMERNGEGSGGLCIGAAKLAYPLLKEKGIEVRVAGGRAAFSVNKGKWGILDYGYDSNPISNGLFVGHFWLVCEFGIIDLSLPLLKEVMRKDNLRRGLSNQSFKLKERMLILRSQNSKFATLFEGKIGWHYLEIDGRGEDIWLDDVPGIPRK